MLWLWMAVFSAVFAGLTAILAKCGIRRTDSDVATALRTAVVLVFSLVMVSLAGSLKTLPQIGGKSFLFLVLSGLATGASWICYFKALSLGDVNKVVPIDKSSTVLTVLLAILFFGETGHLAVRLICTAAIAVGTLLMIERKEDVPDGKTPDGDGKAKKGKRLWLPYAVGSAVFAALTSILAKICMKMWNQHRDRHRTGVVLLLAWAIVFLKGKQTQLKGLCKRELLFIVLSGIATGRVVALLLLRHSEGRRQRGRPHR